MLKYKVDMNDKSAGTIWKVDYEYYIIMNSVC